MMLLETWKQLMSLTEIFPSTNNHISQPSHDKSLGRGILYIKFYQGINIQSPSDIYLQVEFEKQREIVYPMESGSSQNPKFNKILTFETSTNSKSIIKIYVKSYDECIGECKIPIDFEWPRPRMVNQEWINIINASSISSFILLSVEFKKAVNIRDFESLQIIGQGSFGKVMKVRERNNGKIFALKTIDNINIDPMQSRHAKLEKFVLTRLKHPFIIPLTGFFQYENQAHFLLPYMECGDLFSCLQENRRLSKSRAKLYTCEILSALEFLHANNVLYRDLKPENILLDTQGHVMLCDFGLCKINFKPQDITMTLCGTPDYLAPEMILNQEGYGRVVEFWALGTLLYEMIRGIPPFYDPHRLTMFEKIIQEPVQFDDDDLFDEQTRSLISKLLIKDQRQRLGYANGVDEIKEHCFFTDVDWKRIIGKEYDFEELK